MLEKVLHGLIRVGSSLTLGRGRCNRYPQRTHAYFKAFGPKDPIVQGFRAILMLRVILKAQLGKRVGCSTESYESLNSVLSSSQRRARSTKPKTLQL